MKECIRQRDEIQVNIAKLQLGDLEEGKIAADGILHMTVYGIAYAHETLLLIYPYSQRQSSFQTLPNYAELLFPYDSSSLISRSTSSAPFSPANTFVFGV